MARSPGNLGPRGRSRRLALGLVATGAGVLAVAALLAVGARPGWLPAVWPLFWVGALGLLQARAAT